MSATPSTSLPVRIVSCNRVFPANRTVLTPLPSHTTPLSMLDNKSDTFGTTGVVWLYESDAHLPGGGDAFVPSMVRSLQVVLSSFPWWCGSLYRCPLEGSADSIWAEQVASRLPRHCVRFGRLLLSYGALSNPGVPLLLADCPLPLTAVAPSPAELAAKGAWRCQALLAGSVQVRCAPSANGGRRTQHGWYAMHDGATHHVRMRGPCRCCSYRPLAGGPAKYRHFRAPLDRSASQSGQRPALR